jgi:hypothetical protein
MPRTTVYHEIEADVYFDTRKQDYGVDGSPVWDEIIPETMELGTLLMFDREWSEDDLKATFGKDGAKIIIDYVFDLVEDWEDD